MAYFEAHFCRPPEVLGKCLIWASELDKGTLCSARRQPGRHKTSGFGRNGEEVTWKWRIHNRLTLQRPPHHRPFIWLPVRILLGDCSGSTKGYLKEKPSVLPLTKSLQGAATHDGGCRKRSLVAESRVGKVFSLSQIP